ncbi:MAG: SMI1/KNR4 family protein [Polyangiaceae bacterium]
MMSKENALAIAERFAAERLHVEGYSLVNVEVRQVAASDWSFGFALAAPDGVTGTTQIILVDKTTGRARTLRQAIGEGWNGGPPSTCPCGSSVRINGMALPPALVRVIEADLWQPPHDEVLRAVFHDEPVQPSFYSLKYMEFENAHWAAQRDAFYLGSQASGAVPGCLEPARSILIGDLGIDMPFALDYRDPSRPPQVVYLHSKDSSWHLIAESVEVLLDLLRIPGGASPNS